MATDGMKKTSGAWRAAAVTVALILCAFLVLAVVGKFSGPNPQKTLDLFGSEIKVDYLIASGEVVFVLALLGLMRRRIAWAGVVTMFGGFVGYAGYYLFMHDGSCGCFGSVIDLPTWTPFAVDVFAVLSGLSLLVTGGVDRRRVGAVAVIALLLSGVGYVTAQQTAPPTAAELEAAAKKQLEEEQAAARAAADAARENGDDTADAENGDNPMAEQTPEQEAAARRAARIEALGTRASAPERLVRSDLFADIMGQPDGGPAWLVFIYDPECEVCMEKKPDYDDWQVELAESEEPLRVFQITKEEAEGSTGVEYWAWTGSPVTFLVRDGVVTNRWVDEAAPNPEEILFDLEVLEPNFP